MTSATPWAQLIDVSVVSAYLSDHSSPESGQYVFAYTITISNRGDSPVQLLSRHWLVTDANGEVQEVRGEGVVGEQPVILPGASFRYTSGSQLSTPLGYMQGSYYMTSQPSTQASPGEDTLFEVPIAAFSLHTPTALN